MADSLKSKYIFRMWKLKMYTNYYKFKHLPLMAGWGIDEHLEICNLT